MIDLNYTVAQLFNSRDFISSILGISSQNCSACLSSWAIDTKFDADLDNLFVYNKQFKSRIWIPDNKVASCMDCQQTFSWCSRKHHCRLCGRILCINCTNMRDIQYCQSIKLNIRCCQQCHNMLTYRLKLFHQKSKQLINKIPIKYTTNCKVFERFSILKRSLEILLIIVVFLVLLYGGYKYHH